MRHRLLFMALVLIAVTGVLHGCQSVRVANAPEASGSSTLRFARVGTPDSGTIDRGEAGSTFRFHRPWRQPALLNQDRRSGFADHPRALA